MCNRRNLVFISLSVLFVGSGCRRVGPCLTETAPPSGRGPGEFVRLVADPTDDFILDHPLFTELYGVRFENNRSIPPALDIVQVEVLSDGKIHTIKIRTREGGILQQMQRNGQRTSFGVYIDADGNGLSDYLLTTTDSPERGVIVTPEFRLVAEMEGLAFDGNEVTMRVRETIVGSRFNWLAFSGYSPKAEAFTTALANVFFVPQVDVVSAMAGTTGIISFYAGPGTCQVIDSRAVAGCPASPPFTTVPGTSLQGKMFYRKQCGTTKAEFWCVGAAFGARVYGGGTTGWVGRCPYPCGMNWIDAWDSNNDGSLDKVWHVVRDGDCTDTQNPMKHYDYDHDNKIDSMEHTYVFAANQVESCNLERDENSGNLLAKRCCPKRKPYANQMDVPGSGIDGSPPDYNCQLSAP